jgi:demethoxyubiquinone hydroxylase (CLK1/Coq7/Cat5 family)
LGMDPDELHDGMHKALGVFVDMMSAFIATTVMESLGQAVVQHLNEQVDKKDISPFDDEE